MNIPLSDRQSKPASSRQSAPAPTAPAPIILTETGLSRMAKSASVKQRGISWNEMSTNAIDLFVSLCRHRSSDRHRAPVVILLRKMSAAVTAWPQFDRLSRFADEPLLLRCCAAWMRREGYSRLRREASRGTRCLRMRSIFSCRDPRRGGLGGSGGLGCLLSGRLCVRNLTVLGRSLRQALERVDTDRSRASYFTILDFRK